MMRRAGTGAALVAAVVTLALGACAKRGPRLPRPLGVEEFVVPWPNAFPSDVVVDDGGVVWFTDRFANVIGRFEPETGRFERVTLPGRLRTPYGFVRAPDGRLWFAASGSGSVGVLDPATREIEEHRLEGATGGPHLIAWREGEIWFTLREGHGFGRYDPRRRTTRIFPPEDESERPYSIGVAPNGHVWVGVINGTKLYEVDPETERYQVHDISTPPPPGEPWGYATLRDSTGRGWTVTLSDSTEVDALPPAAERTVRANRRRVSARRLAVDAEGRVWVTDFHGGRVVRYDPETGEVRSYADRDSAPYGIAASSTGHVWYGDQAFDQVVVLEPESGERAVARMATRQATVRHLAVDVKRNRVWLPMSDGGRLGLVRLAPIR